MLASLAQRKRLHKFLGFETIPDVLLQLQCCKMWDRRQKAAARRAVDPTMKPVPSPKGQAKAKPVAASVTNVSSSAGASSKEVEKLKSKLVAAEKMQAAQARPGRVCKG